jgi:hypothetical protein
VIQNAKMPKVVVAVILPDDITIPQSNYMAFSSLPVPAEAAKLKLSTLG